MTIATDDAHRAAIAAAPDDDAARLVWADLLQGRGDPRGELIALQVAEAQADAAGDRDRAEALADAADELLGDHEDAWTPPGLAAEVLADDVGFRRGFVEAIELNADQLVDLLDELADAAP